MNRVAIVSYKLWIAKPLAGKKLSKRTFKLVRLAAENKCLKRGVKEVVKSICRGGKGLCVIAGNISPVDVITHVPVLCEENDIPYIYVTSKEDLANAGATKRPTCCVLVTTKPTKGEIKQEEQEKPQSNYDQGSMLAPHVNPTATEYGIVLRGSGTIQIVLPNGTLALNANVREGDVFWVPRYFPFCQIASGSGPFEIFGFTTSSRKNHPQFLVGANSLLHTLKGPEIATAFGVNEERFKEIINAQHEGVILPSSNGAPPEVTKKQMQDNADMKIPEFVKSFGTEMIMGFD